MDDLLQRPGNMVAEYTGAAAGRDYDYWREGVCRNFCRVDAEPSAGSQIFCKIEITQVGSLALATTSGRSGRFVRSRDLLSELLRRFCAVRCHLRRRTSWFASAAPSSCRSRRCG